MAGVGAVVSFSLDAPRYRSPVRSALQHELHTGATQPTTHHGPSFAPGVNAIAPREPRLRAHHLAQHRGQATTFNNSGSIPARTAEAVACNSAVAGSVVAGDAQLESNERCREASLTSESPLLPNKILPVAVSADFRMRALFMALSCLDHAGELFSRTSPSFMTSTTHRSTTTLALRRCSSGVSALAAHIQMHIACKFAEFGNLERNI